MKSDITERPSNFVESYPVLMRHTPSGRIILFTEAGRGTVVHFPGYPSEIGRNGAWAEDQYVPFHGTVILSN